MKIKVTMKDPDCLHDAIREAVEVEVKPLGLEDEETEAVTTLRIEKAEVACAKWFRYSEYLTVEIDTDADTATVERAR